MTSRRVSTEPQFYRLEGVWLTESGMSLLRTISMSPLHKRRQRRSRLGGLCEEGGGPCEEGGGPCGEGGDALELKEGDGDGDEGKGWRSAPCQRNDTKNTCNPSSIQNPFLDRGFILTNSTFI